ncbi:sensor histidine kinase [Alkaliphilus sp. MSJ-5]|uniref:histidine kinase n=1 Tax=Alkaliphilus flagellatus TaxID=2841507 RepID=A0ABS6G0D0_9FIRM|nr:sensor histidine kinase [Alkaliphilus flagellatus]MBU5675955.1 sensor histidine kinase [Alkaliphilus flagellatus]
MKLFIKDNLWIVFLYSTTFWGLSILLNTLGELENNFGYFVFLSFFLLVCFLIYRYASNYRLYKKLSSTPETLEDILIHNSFSSLENAFDITLYEYFKLYNTKLSNLSRKQEEYKLLINQSVHQMKTPISVINLIAQNNEDSKDFERITAETKRLDYTLWQTLNFLCLDDISNDLKIEKINLKKLVSDVINDLKYFFITKSIYPKLSIDDNVYVYTDAKWMKCVIYQIANNAIKYGRKDTLVFFEIYKRNENFILKITNEGIGIQRSDINRIFDLFFTGDNGRGFGESTGVGLYIVKKITDLLSHKITVDSTPNEKTTFYIEF